MSTADIRQKLCAVYNQNGMNDGTVRQWCRMFKDGQTNIHDEKQWSFTISELLCEFP
jgi:hypothetical protein